MKKQFLGLLFLTVALAGTLEAQTLKRGIEYETLDVDTLTNAGTLTFTFSKYILDLYDLSWIVAGTSISGTPAATVTLEASNCESCADWEDLASWSLTANGLDTIFIQPSFPGIRARVQVVGSGTQSTQIRNHLRWLRRKE